ncbi:MAG: acyltransferase family protein, partial [Myxococcota bacterium]
MDSAATLRKRAEARLRRLPIPALRDIVNKQPTAGPNLDALDGIRGLAVLLVLASHTGAFQLQGHGGVGVWLFFGLSAFLLTMPFAARPERAASWPDLRHYFARRLRRILP